MTNIQKLIKKYEGKKRAMEQVAESVYHLYSDEDKEIYNLTQKLLSDIIYDLVLLDAIDNKN